ARVLDGSATETDRRNVLDWTRNSESNKFQFDQLQKFWNQTSGDLKLIGHEEQKKRIWNAHLAESNKNKTISATPQSRWGWLKVAAIIAVLLLPTYLIMNRTEEIAVETKPEMEVVHKINPTGQKSQIQLPDGSKAWLNA